MRLRQTRVAPGWSHYFAIRTKDLVRGTPDEYLALVAISERQASISVSRVIRDGRGFNDNDASKMRNNIIRKGWLTNARPPELTMLGLSLLT